MNVDHVLETVSVALERLVQASDPHGGLFPSMLDRRTGQMLSEAPEPIHGQRSGDRAYRGSNLIHDEAALLTLFALSKALGRDDFAQAGDRYLQRFATHCTQMETGLYPWGEHAYWDLVKDRVGNSYTKQFPSREGGAIHDHLRQAPAWLWEKLHAFNPEAVTRFAEGLDYHWTDGDGDEYCRHASLQQAVRLNRDIRSCDFPRHSGFYIFDLSFACARSGRTDLLEQIRRYLDYWWHKRDAQGLLRIESRSPEGGKFHEINAPAQTLSLAASLLESADILEPTVPELAADMRTRAKVYVDGFFAAPHDPDRGVFVILCRCGSGEITGAMPVWGSVYGEWPASYVGLTCLCTYRRTGDGRLLDWAAAAGRAYAAEPFPADINVPAMDTGMGLGLLADLYDVTDDEHWLAAGMKLADRVQPLYLEDELPRGAAGIGWYESQMGPGFLLHGLARLALLAGDKKTCPLPADYTGR